MYFSATKKASKAFKTSLDRNIKLRNQHHLEHELKYHWKLSTARNKTPSSISMETYPADFFCLHEVIGTPFEGPSKTASSGTAGSCNSISHSISSFSNYHKPIVIIHCYALFLHRISLHNTTLRTTRKKMIQTQFQTDIFIYVS